VSHAELSGPTGALASPRRDAGELVVLFEPEDGPRG
jgi:hypothetical protein